MTDFELTIGAAAKQVFEDIELQKCFFHFSQSITRKASKLKKRKILNAIIKNQKNKSEEQVCFYYEIFNSHFYFDIKLRMS